MQPGFRISALEKTSEDSNMGLFKNSGIDGAPSCSSRSHQISMRRERLLALQLAMRADCLKL